MYNNHIKVLFHCLGLFKRLKLFRDRNEEDVTVFNYFDEFEIHPLPISWEIQHTSHTIITLCFNFTEVEEDHSPKLLSTVETLKKKIGEPRNYGKMIVYDIFSIQIKDSTSYDYVVM